MAQPATASPTQPCPCHHVTQALRGDKPPSETASTLLHKQLLCISFKRAEKKKESSNCCCMCHSPDCVLVCAAASESWVLQGLSHPVRLRDCRPRHRSLVSGRPREDSCVDVGKSILLATASSESWKSAQIENKQKLESSGLLFFRKEFSEALSPKAGLALL